MQPLVYSTFSGCNTTCFAYGQTGSGKTHTMMGTSNGQHPGMYILAASDIIEQLENYPEIYLTISFYEIYCGKLYDLLNERELVKCMEDAQQRMNIMGLTEVPVDSVAKIMEIITNALQIRTSGKTGANDTSSRSHAIL